MSKELKALEKTNGTNVGEKKKVKKKKACKYWQYRDFDDVGLYIGKTGKLYGSEAKKLKNIYCQVYSTENLVRSAWKAQKGKGRRTEIENFNDVICENLSDLWEMLYYQTYSPGEYRLKEILDPKKRIISIAPFYPDRIIHHCIINVLSQHWTSLFIANTYACIEGRGTHQCMMDVHKALIEDKQGTLYCLKIDIRKYFDSVDHRAMKRIVRYTIADEQMLWLIDTIIDSNGKDKGLPIGNYTSQYLANLYLAYFDHWVKEDLGIKYYYRYMDDMVVLAEDKTTLHCVLNMFALYLGSELKLEIKDNWQIFPVDDRGIDFCGFRQNHHGIMLRKSILMKFYKKYRNMIDDLPQIKTEEDIKHLFPSEYGWIIRCDAVHSTWIFNKLIQDGNKHFINRTDSSRKACQNRRSPQRTGNSVVQSQHG